MDADERVAGRRPEADAAGPNRISVPVAIEIAGLSKRFDTTRDRRHLALTDISLAVAEGQFVSILGPSGCGKSTLLYMVGGFVAPTM